MRGVEQITAEILAQAQSDAEETVKKAEELKSRRMTELEERLASQKAERETALAKESENVISRRLTLAGLEMRMAKLGAKQAVVSEVYALAIRKAVAMDANKYRDFYARLVCRVAADGDTVLVAKPDSKRLDKSWLDALAKKCGKKLTLGGTCEAAGGVVVVGAKSETDMTLDTLVAEIRLASESDVLDALFGEK